MTFAAVGVDHDRICRIKHGIVRNPTVVVNLDIQAGDLFQTGLEKHATGIEFMVSRAVTWSAGDEDEFFVGGGVFCEGRRRDGQRAGSDQHDQASGSESFHMY